MKRNTPVVLALLLALLLLFSFSDRVIKQDSGRPAQLQQQAEQAQALGIMKVHFIDVGEADSILIQCPAGQALLIDGGNNNDGTLVIEYLKKQGVQKLDVVIATHPHEDHIGGLDVIIKAFAVSSVYMPDKSINTKTFTDFVAAVNSSKAKKIQAKLGVKLDVAGIEAVFLAPIEAEYENLNNYSAVLKLTHGNNSFLFTSDAETEEEKEILLQSQVQINADVLKVGHHGSTSSTSPQFLKQVNPSYAVISVGKGNDYGHPHRVTLNKLAAAVISVYRTDEGGTIIANSDGETIKFNK